MKQFILFSITEIIMHRLANNFIQNDLLFAIFASKEKRRQDEALKILHRFTERVIERRRVSLEKELAEKQSIGNMCKEIRIERRRDLLSVCTKP